MLRSIAYIVKGNALSSSEIEDGCIPVIAGGQTSSYNHSHANYEGNVITVSSSGAYTGYVWYHDSPIYATDCCVIFSRDESRYITKYLFEVLKLQQNSIYKLQTGLPNHTYMYQICNCLTLQLFLKINNNRLSIILQIFDTQQKHCRRQGYF